jgi:hypothetical protein
MRASFAKIASGSRFNRRRVLGSWFSQRPAPTFPMEHSCSRSRDSARRRSGRRVRAEAELGPMRRRVRRNGALPAKLTKAPGLTPCGEGWAVQQLPSTERLNGRGGAYCLNHMDHPSTPASWAAGQSPGPCGGYRIPAGAVAVPAGSTRATRRALALGETRTSESSKSGSGSSRPDHGGRPGQPGRCQRPQQCPPARSTGDRSANGVVIMALSPGHCWHDETAICR